MSVSLSPMRSCAAGCRVARLSRTISDRARSALCRAPDICVPASLRVAAPGGLYLDRQQLAHALDQLAKGRLPPLPNLAATNVQGMNRADAVLDIQARYVMRALRDDA